jgi:hypothetical protein
MRFAVASVCVAFLTSFAMAAQRSVIISFPNDTPDSVVEDCKESIRSNGGVITHEYNIIKGFAAKAESSALEFVTTMGSKYSMEMEEDGIVTTQDE